MTIKTLIIGLILALGLAGCATNSANPPHVTHLRCESLSNPQGIDVARPRLSWQIASRRRGERQVAYQVIVGSSPERAVEGKADVWDSGRVEGDVSTGVPYAGPMVPSFARRYWRVRVWDKDGRPSSWSGVATWEVGPTRPGDWAARWIRPAAGIAGPLLRREFAVDRPVKAARAYVCGLGYYELHLNGQKVGDHVLDPAQTDYEQRALYATYDVTPLLRAGGNAVGLMLGTGWFDQGVVWGGMSYGRPCAICLLRIEYEDGTVATVGTGQTWRCAAGPVVRDNVYAGEAYDARRERIGWDRAAFDDAGWKAADEIASPTARLEPQLMPAVKVARVIDPVATTRPKDGVAVYDLGENIAGWARVRVAAPAGTVVKMRFAETIGKDGNVDTASTGVFATNVEQTDTYTCKGGGGEEEWEPRFTYHGFRYVEVSGLPPGATLARLQGVVVHTAVAPAGTFECSDPMLNRIHAMAVRTELDNLHGVPTDCPARERCGWLGDAHATAEMTICNFDMARFWPKYLRDIETSRHGQLPGDVAPGKRCSGPNGNTDWGAALVMIPWYQYLYYGDADTLREHYPAMRQFVLGVKALAKDGIVSKGYGDWCPPGSVQPVETPVELTTTAWLWRVADVMCRAAGVAGHPEDSAEFARLAADTAKAFNARFFDPIKGSYGSQTGDAVALAWGLVPAGREQAVADDLARDVVERHHLHHSTGIFGSRYLYWALARYGHADIAMSLLHQTTYPSIGYLISRGATTFWECWGEDELDRKWGARSLNHPMQGAFDAWFYQGVLGINADPADPGFHHVILRPQMTGQLGWAKGAYDGPYGRIVSDWRSESGDFTWHVVVPPNSSATVHLPDGSPAKEVGSGDYTFRSRLADPAVLRTGPRPE